MTGVFSDLATLMNIFYFVSTHTMESTAGENRETGKPQKFIDLDPKQEWWGETDKQLTGRKKSRRWDGMGYTIGYDAVQVINQVGSELERQSVGS